MTRDRSLATRVRSRLQRGRTTADPQVVALQQQVDQLAAAVEKLRTRAGRLGRRVEQLEDELLDARSQGRRLAEISEVVTELLAHEASKNDPEFQRIVDRLTSERRG